MTAAYDIVNHAISLVEGASVDRAIASGRYEVTTIDEAQAAMAAAGIPYPVLIEPATLSWGYPPDHTTTSVDQRWDTVDFELHIFVTPHSMNPMDTNEEIAEIAYDIRRTLGDPSSWVSSVSEFISVELDRCTVEAVDTNYDGAAQQQIDFLYAIRQPVTVIYREDHT